MELFRCVKVKKIIRDPLTSQLFQQFFKIFRQRRGKFHVFLPYRMLKAQDHGMEGLSLERRKRTLFRSVENISQKRMADTGHVYPDLMRPAGFQLAFNIGIVSKPFRTLKWVTASFPPRTLTAIFFRSTGCRPMAPSTVPESSFIFPWTMARYLLVILCTFSCSPGSDGRYRSYRLPELL